MAFEAALTFDLETGTKVINKRKAQRWHPDNYVNAAGFQYGNNETFGAYYASKYASFAESHFPNLDAVKLLIGFNIKFDLLWEWHDTNLQQFFKDGGEIWDCQYVEYLLGGMQQRYHMASMDGTIPAYGGTLKMDAVKEMWEQGIDTPDIPEDLLMKYLTGDEEEDLEGDVNNTWLIFLGQMKRINEDFPPATLQMIKNRMDGLLATTEMEYNGLMIDVELGNELREVQKTKLDQMTLDLEKYIPKLPEELVFNWNSNHHKSFLIFGGVATYEKWQQHVGDDGFGVYATKIEKHYMVDGITVEPEAAVLEQCDKFKSGKRIGEYKTKNVKVPDTTKPKGCKQKFTHTFKGFTTPEHHWKSKSLIDATGAPIYSTSADVIEELAGTRNVPFLKLLQARSKLKKDLGTYYWDEDDNGNRKGMLTLVGNDGIIHHKLNHTSTVTSRLSSSDPNMQNIPKADKSDVKQLFISRFPQGKMGEIDYSQLEVVIQGVLSRDPQLIKDLQAGIDFHCKRLAIKLGESYESVTVKVDAGIQTYVDGRSDIKSFTFERAYGAGAASIAANNNIPIDEVKELIANEERMYPGVAAFDKTVESSIAASRTLTHTEVYVNGAKFRLGRGHWYSPTGTKYIWTEGEAPKFLWKYDKYTGFKPTERKNWPIQGTGGEVVQTMIGILWRWLISHDRFDNKALLCNTVHDCVWLDMADDETVAAVIPMACKILESVPAKFNKDFNLGIDVPFPVEAEVGINMYNLTHYKVD